MADEFIRSRVDLGGLDAQIDAFAVATGRRIGEVVRDQSRLLAIDLIKATPPIRSYSLQDSWADQRAVGLNAIERDLRTLFYTLDNLAAWRPSRQTPFTARLTQAAAAGNIATVEAMSAAAKMRWQFIAAPTDELHNRARNKRGRINKGMRGAYVVRDKRALERYIREKKKLAGRAKAGWMPAARQLGARGIPNWIAGQMGEGSGGNLQQRGMHSPFVRLINRVSYIQIQEADTRLVERAIRDRAKAMQRQLDAAKKGLWRARR